MTDNELIKALECCKKEDCDNCPTGFGVCFSNLVGYALDLINRQKAEIEDIKFLYENLKEEHLETIKAIKHCKAEACKAFAEMLKAKAITHTQPFSDKQVLYVCDIDSTYNELAGDPK